MGLESAIYTFVPRNWSAKTIDELLVKRFSAIRTPSASRFDEYVVGGQDYCIEVQVAGPQSVRQPFVSVRIALSNPSAADVVLVGMLRELLASVGGTIRDGQSRKEYGSEHELSANEILEHYHAKQRAFREWFGPEVRAEGSRAVMDFYRKKKGTGPPQH